MLATGRGRLGTWHGLLLSEAFDRSRNGIINNDCLGTASQVTP